MAWLDWPHSPDAQMLPYAQATPGQRSQALLGAREALDPYYPTLTWPHWHQAFRDLQPALRLEAGQVAVPFEVLTEFTRYFEALLPDQLPPSEAGLLASRVKKTFSVHLELLERLTRVSFWRQEGKSDLVNRALLQLLNRYPEAHIPLPPPATLS